MGRPAKNPEHPLTRLRKALSTPTQEMTRAIFSKKVGIPEATIKAIETGKFKISDKHAAQIASVTKVNPKCLIDPSLPLDDYMGIPLEAETGPIAAYFGDEFLDAKALVETALEVAEEKRKQSVFLFLFQRWLEETSETLGLGPAITNKLQERYPPQCFGAIPTYFWPKDRKKRKEMDKHVMRFEKELIAEILKVLSLPEKMTDLLHAAKESLTDPEAFQERLGNADEPIRNLLVEKILRAGFRYADLVWALRKKKIEEAKASDQKQPKHSRTR
jgi:DNA-binding XRE family transcriptional regulator